MPRASYRDEVGKENAAPARRLATAKLRTFTSPAVATGLHPRPTTRAALQHRHQQETSPPYRAGSRGVGIPVTAPATDGSKSLSAMFRRRRRSVDELRSLQHTQWASRAAARRAQQAAGMRIAAPSMHSVAARQRFGPEFYRAVQAGMRERRADGQFSSAEPPHTSGGSGVLSTKARNGDRKPPRRVWQHTAAAAMNQSTGFTPADGDGWLSGQSGGDEDGLHSAGDHRRHRAFPASRRASLGSSTAGASAAGRATPMAATTHQQSVVYVSASSPVDEGGLREGDHAERRRRRRQCHRHRYERWGRSPSPGAGSYSGTGPIRRRPTPLRRRRPQSKVGRSLSPAPSPTVTYSDAEDIDDDNSRRQGGSPFRRRRAVGSPTDTEGLHLSQVLLDTAAWLGLESEGELLVAAVIAGLLALHMLQTLLASIGGTILIGAVAAFVVAVHRHGSVPAHRSVWVPAKQATDRGASFYI